MLYIINLDNLDESIDISKTFETSVAVGQHSFSKMTVDVDRKKKFFLIFIIQNIIFALINFKRTYCILF